MLVFVLSFECLSLLFSTLFSSSIYCSAEADFGEKELKSGDKLLKIKITEEFYDPMIKSVSKIGELPLALVLVLVVALVAIK